MNQTSPEIITSDYKLSKGVITIDKSISASRINEILSTTAYSKVIFTNEFENLKDSIGSSGKGISLGISVPNIETLEEEGISDSDSGPIMELVNNIITTAITRKASDIHIEPGEKSVEIKLRVDGSLETLSDIDQAISAYINARIKILASLNLTEKRKPQDGKIIYDFNGRRISLRVSFMPSYFGERCVLRILDDVNAKSISVSDESKSIKSIIDTAQGNNGIIILCGPTGSGKTTTLYTVVNELKKNPKNILTIEDPIEYQIPGVGQTQVDEENGITFETGLRAILRQDPDIILVGEIRDMQTAKMAVQSSLTGHMVLTTLHTNTSLGAINRLLNLGVEADMVFSTIRIISSQRLIKRLCDCAIEAENPVTIFSKEIVNHKVTSGCSKCSGTGYKGRVAVHDTIKITNEVKEGILAKDKDLLKEYNIHKIFKSEVMDLIDSGIIDYNQAKSASLELLGE